MRPKFLAPAKNQSCLVFYFSDQPCDALLLTIEDFGIPFRTKETSTLRAPFERRNPKHTGIVKGMRMKNRG
jgi:hypothetical protein